MSVIGKLVEALESKLVACAPNATVVKRRAVEMRPGDPLPLVIIGLPPSGEGLEEIAFNRGLMWGYPIKVGIYMASNRSIDLDLSWLDFRESVRDQVYQRITWEGGAAADFEMVTSPPFGQADTEGTMSATVFDVIYKVEGQGLG